MRLGDLDALKKEFDIIASNSATGEWQLIPIKHIKQIVDNAPTVEEKWNKQHTELLRYFAECEKCGEEIMTSHKNYCPNCGAILKGSEGND